MGGDNQAPDGERQVCAQQPTPHLFPFPLLPHVPPSSLPLPPRCLVPAMTKWGWAMALAAIQPDSLTGPTKCLSGSPTVTTGAFYYSVKWGVKECYGCSYLTIQDVSLLGRKIGGQISRSNAFVAQVRRNNPMLLFTSQIKTKVPFFFSWNLSRNMLTSHRIITCIPYAIQTDGSRTASWKDLLEGDPDIGTQNQQIYYVQLNYAPRCVFPD